MTKKISKNIIKAIAKNIIKESKTGFGDIKIGIKVVESCEKSREFTIFESFMTKAGYGANIEQFKNSKPLGQCFIPGVNTNGGKYIVTIYLQNLKKEENIKLKEVVRHEFRHAAQAVWYRKEKGEEAFRNFMINESIKNYEEQSLELDAYEFQKENTNNVFLDIESFPSKTGEIGCSIREIAEPPEWAKIKMVGESEFVK